MTQTRRCIALVCMTPEPDANELSHMELPSYGVRRILAATMADRELGGARVSLIDMPHPDVAACVDAIDSLDADLVGMSVYVWSAPFMVEVARQVKRRRPHCAIVFGGPSARSAFLDLAPYTEPHTYVDALVPSDGEETFRDIARLPAISRAALESVPGLELPGPAGWTRTPPRPPLRLDGLASPFQMGLMPDKTVAYLETYRGCPMSCVFCEWGAATSNAVFSTEYLTRELEAYARRSPPAVFLVDAGLNLNAKGFRNLREAESRVGALRSAQFWCEVYPSIVREEHVQFLSEVGPSYLGIGLQSLDPEVLKRHQRPFGVERFEEVVRTLSRIATAEVQIIFGLPGDTPDGFRRTLAYARSLPVGVRAYHCLVLPDALLTRGKPEWRMQYDLTTLEMIACEGWEAGELQAMRTHLTAEAATSGGRGGRYWWYFPPAR